jgi:hypothetical protein
MSATTNQYKQTATIIRDQINAVGFGFPSLLSCAGAKNFVFLNGESMITPGDFIRGGLMFSVAFMHGDVRGVKVIVELDVMDTYNVVIGRTRGTSFTVLHSAEGIYCDQLGYWVADKLGLGDFTN